MATIQRGVLVPDSNDVQQIVNQLLSDVKTNPDPLRQNMFKSDPVRYVSGLGLNVDSTREILNEIGLGYATAADASWCIITCICSNCCITNIPKITIVVLA